MLLMNFHVVRAMRTFSLTRAENQNRFAAVANNGTDEGVRRLYFHPLRTPAKLRARRRITASDKIDPERVGNRGRQSMRIERKPLSFRRTLHCLKRIRHPRSDNRILNKRISAYDVNRFGELSFFQ